MLWESRRPQTAARHGCLLHSSIRSLEVIDNMYKRVTFLIFTFLLVGAVMIVVGKRIDTIGIVLRVPLEQSSETKTHEFTVPTTAQYRIGVECSRNLPLERLKLLLQQGNLVEVGLHCGATPVTLNYFPQPQLSQSPDSSGQLGNLNSGQDTLGQDIASFNGSRGAKYQVSCTVIRSLGELSATNPTFIVYLDPTPDIRRGILAIVLLVGGYTFLALGAALGIYHFLLGQRVR